METAFDLTTRLRAIARAVALAACLGVPAWVPAQADDAARRAGRAFAIENCRECHDVGDGRKLLSAMSGPSFRDVAEQPATTPLSLKVFLITSHPPMPNIILSKTEIDNLIAYIMSLRPAAKEKL